ncbi:MAG TPA: trehalase family glycosidase [Acidobacteriaceae bacterium]|nr:trehalase family glycosidase [Acidobacteriaceae bacterium]
MNDLTRLRKARYGKAVVWLFALGFGCSSPAQTRVVPSRLAPGQSLPAESSEYRQVQQRLAQGWNTWDVHSVTTQVLLPQGLAIHTSLKHNTTEGSDAFLGDTLIGRLTPHAEQVTPGPHAWDGSYTDLRVAWHGHEWRMQSAQADGELVMLATPLSGAQGSALPPTIIFSVDFLWNRPGTITGHDDFIEAQSPTGTARVFCTCAPAGSKMRDQWIDSPVRGPFFSADFTGPIGIGTGKRRTLDEIRVAVEKQRQAYEESIHAAGSNAPIVDAIETTLGWDTIYEPAGERVVSPVSRVWSVDWGGYVIFDWDNFFAATMAGIGDRDLAYANALETLRGETNQGFVPNYARGGGWKSFDRSEPPVGAVTVLGLYRKSHDRWFLRDAFDPLLRWNRWWATHRDIDGYLAWGSDGDNSPGNLDDQSRGTRVGAVLESGLDNSPMYDTATYNEQKHVLEYADVGLMSLYIADCDALAKIAQELGMAEPEKELTERAARYRAKLATLWNDEKGIFLNKDLHTGQSNTRLSPTNFYPMLAHAATPDQAHTMIAKHLKNPAEFWGQWVIPSIERDDPAFHDQNYWRGRIWGPMNYLVYLGLCNYDDAAVRQEFAQKSYALFLKEWTEHRHVHENYNSILGSGDDVSNSDRFYHWGALLGYIEYLEASGAGKRPPSGD